MELPHAISVRYWRPCNVGPTSNVSILDKFATCRHITLLLFKTTTENKTSATTHCKKLTTGNYVCLNTKLSEVTVTSCSFYMKCSPMCPPSCWTNHTWNVLLQKSSSVAAFKTLTFHKVVYRWHTWGVVGSLVAVLLRMFFWFWQWINVENRLAFYELRRTKQSVPVFWPPCIRT